MAICIILRLKYNWSYCCLNNNFHRWFYLSLCHVQFGNKLFILFLVDVVINVLLMINTLTHDLPIYGLKIVIINVNKIQCLSVCKRSTSAKYISLTVLKCSTYIILYLWITSTSKPIFKFCILKSSSYTGIWWLTKYDFFYYNVVIGYMK